MPTVDINPAFILKPNTLVFCHVWFIAFFIISSRRRDSRHDNQMFSVDGEQELTAYMYNFLKATNLDLVLFIVNNSSLNNDAWSSDVVTVSMSTEHQDN